MKEEILPPFIEDHPPGIRDRKLGGALEECVGGYDLIYNGLPVRPDKQSCYTSRLGCFDDRVRQLKKLHKAHSKRGGGGS